MKSEIGSEDTLQEKLKVFQMFIFLRLEANLLAIVHTNLGGGGGGSNKTWNTLNNKFRSKN
jgi:hypothetical protein